MQDSLYSIIFVHCCNTELWYQCFCSLSIKKILFSWASISSQEIAAICKELPALVTLNLSYNSMSHDISGMPLLNHIKVVVLSHTGIGWKQVRAAFCCLLPFNLIVDWVRGTWFGRSKCLKTLSLLLKSSIWWEISWEE